MLHCGLIIKRFRQNWACWFYLQSCRARRFRIMQVCALLVRAFHYRAGTSIYPFMVCAVFRFDTHYYNKETNAHTPMANDNELVQEYVRSASESAFAELVRRHVNMVYSAALRETSGDASMAEELTQLVFVELSRKAARLIRHPALAGWLYTCVRWTAANALRAEDSRQRRHLEYQTMSQLLSSESPESTWQQVRPVLDDTLHELGETDRAAIVLRFFEDLSLQQVGIQLGLNENAARMRVDRALRKLRDRLLRRGITSTSSALAAAMVAGAIVSAPSGLAANIVTSAVGPSTAQATAASAKLLKSTLGAKKLMLIGTGGAFLLGTVGSILLLRSHPALAQHLHYWLTH
jgi:RNA polymerase sigma factor (sigma-70 family)